MSLRILVTGGAGYLGSTLVPVLLREGYSVTVLDSLIYDQFPLLECCSNKRFEFRQGDICNKSILKALVKSYDLIIPLAAIVGALACSRNPKLANLVNYTAHIDLIKFLSRDQKVIFPSTK